uniref:Uncharacterized protein n=1 Tax=Panagrolaimus sp. JU765 TaxID=591449 RepID=A0AC34R9U0_9BILA
MDTISLMQQLLPHLQASQSSSTTSAAKFSSQLTQRPLMNPNPPFGLIKISPTTAVVDANTGLPTAAVAESPSLLGLMSATEAALPPETASTSGGMSSASSTASNIVNYMAAVQAAAALQSDILHSAFRTPFPTQPSPSSSASSDSFLTLALNSFVSPSENSSDGSKCDNNSSGFFLNLAFESFLNQFLTLQICNSKSSLSI